MITTDWIHLLATEAREECSNPSPFSVCTPGAVSVSPFDVTSPGITALPEVLLVPEGSPPSVVETGELPHPPANALIPAPARTETIRQRTISMATAPFVICTSDFFFFGGSYSVLTSRKSAYSEFPRPGSSER